MVGASYIESSVQGVLEMSLRAVDLVDRGRSSSLG